MYEISVEQHIDAAHFLRGYQGKCEELHGHRFRVVVRLRVTDLDDIGLAYDFTVLKKQLALIIAGYDHTCFNDVPPFDEINPSSENIAATIYHNLLPELEGESVTLSALEIWESPLTGVTYRPD